ncbi:UPAR/Ly6 domain-containing protein crok-like [Cloeon dipterum]|uniref:UPAR/Ly6 domain-containing protein crok-like n=1 Tax=Cloeon dipterum TaxID=197152 RepID=UPI00321FA760
MELTRDSTWMLLVVGVVLCFLAPQGECIKCYECNSEYDPRCADPFDSYSIGEVDCDLKPKLDHLNHLNATLCRKMAQKVNGKHRTVRSCGYLPAEDNKLGCILRSGTYEVHVQYCACQGDLCNEGARAAPAAPLAVVAAAAAGLAARRLL